MSTTTAREQRRARTLDDPRFERLRNPRSRRGLVAALVALLVIEAALFVALDHPALLWPGLAGLVVLLVVFVICLGALKASTRGLEELPERALDERQEQVRGRIYASAYRLGAALLTTGLVVIALWIQFDFPHPGQATIIGALVLPFHIAIVLPTLIAAVRDDL